MSLDGIIRTAQSVTADFFNVEHAAEVTVGEKAEIYTAGDTEISAKVNQTGGILDITSLTDALNLVNVKVGSAKVDVNGIVFAGVNLGAVLDSDNNLIEGIHEDNGTLKKAYFLKKETGNIDITSEVKSTVEAGSSVAYLSSLAVSVAVLNSGLTVGSTALLNASGNVVMTADGETEVTTHASAGSLPISLAVTAVVNNVQALVNGAVIKADGSVTLEAKGVVKATITANKGKDSKYTSGGYFAVDVVVQDVLATLKNAANVEAKKNVKVASTATANVNTTATSAAPSAKKEKDKDKKAADDNGSKENSVADVKSIAKLLLGNILTKIGKEELDSKLTSGLRTVQYSITLSPGISSDKGQVTVSRSKANGPEGESQGTPVAITAVPKEGYKVSRIYLLRLVPGAERYKQDGPDLDLSDKTVHTGPNEYTFNMRPYDVIVCVEFEESQTPDPQEENLDFSELFGGNDDEQQELDYDLSSLFDDATGGADDGLSDFVVVSSDSEDAVALYFNNPDKDKKGALLTNLLIHDDNVPDEDRKVLPGGKVQILVNPKTGYRMKEGSLFVQYSTETTSSNEPFAADSQGRYFFTVPEGVVGKIVNFSCEWEEIPTPTASPKPTAKPQTGNTAAAIQDNTAIHTGSKASLDGVSVIANQKITDTVSGKAGSAGGVSVTPILALDITGGSAEAYLGAGDTISLDTLDNLGAVKTLKNVVVFARNEAKHDIKDDASSAGDKAAVGGSFDISIVNDSASAKLARSVTANGVYVGAESESTLKSVSTAAAKGTQSSGEKGKADRQADKMVGGGAGLTKVNGSKNIKTSAIMKKNANRQQAQTSEDSVSVAAGFALNIQDNRAQALIDGGDTILDITAIRNPSIKPKDGKEPYEKSMNGVAHVVSLNRTVSEIQANASTAGSSVGVGVGVVINILTINNKALLDHARVMADSLDVSAIIRHGEPKEAKKKINTGSASSELIKRMRDLLNEKLTDLFDEMGLYQYSQKIAGGITGIITNIVNDLATTPLKGTGFEKLLDVNPDTFEKEWSVDASAAVNLLDSKLSARVETGVHIVTTGKDTVETDPEAAKKAAEQAKKDYEAELEEFEFNKRKAKKAARKIAEDAAKQENGGIIPLGFDELFEIRFEEQYTQAHTEEDYKANLDATVVTKQEYIEEHPKPELQKPEPERANLLVIAREKGGTEVSASSYAMGGSAAVGAAVAVNIIDTQIDSAFEGIAELRKGSAYILAASTSEDVSNAIATAMGADMARYTEAFRKGEQAASSAIDDVTTGKIYDKQSGKSDSKTGKKINDKLNKESEKKAGSSESTQETKDNAPLSTNMLKSQNVDDKTNTGKADTEIQAAGDAANGASDKNLGVTSTQQEGEESRKVQVAAAVGLTVSKHVATTKMDGTIVSANGAKILAGNAGNFRTLGTGAAVSLANKSNSVAMGVAVSVNRNEANTEVSGTVTGISGKKPRQDVAASASGAITKARNVSVAADTRNDLWLLAITFGAGADAGVAGGVNALIFKSRTDAALGGSVAAESDVNVNANADNLLLNIAAAAGGGKVGVSAVAMVTYFQGVTNANLLENASIGTKDSRIGGMVRIIAASKELVTADALGVSGGLTAGVGITGLLSVSLGNVAATVGTKNNIDAGDVNVKANNARNIVTAAATAAVGGTTGVGATLTVVIAGAKMNQDAHATLYGGDSSVMQPEAQM